MLLSGLKATTQLDGKKLERETLEDRENRWIRGQCLWKLSLYGCVVAVLEHRCENID